MSQVSFWDYCFIAVIAILLMSLPFSIWAMFRISKHERRSLGEYSVRKRYVTTFLIFVFTIPLVFSGIRSAARSSFKATLNSLPSDCVVIVNDRPAQNGVQVLEMLKTLHDTSAKHSSPTTKIRVEIESKTGTLIIELKRDSKDPKEYWLYLPMYSALSNMNSDVFRQMLWTRIEKLRRES